MSEIALRDFLCDLSFSSKSSYRAFCPVNCPAKVHLLPFLACEAAKVSRLGVGSPHAPLSFVAVLNWSVVLKALQSSGCVIL